MRTLHAYALALLLAGLAAPMPAQTVAAGCVDPTRPFACVFGLCDDLDVNCAALCDSTTCAAIDECIAQATCHPCDTTVPVTSVGVVLFGEPFCLTFSGEPQVVQCSAYFGSGSIALQAGIVLNYPDGTGSYGSAPRSFPDAEDTALCLGAVPGPFGTCAPGEVAVIVNNAVFTCLPPGAPPLCVGPPAPGRPPSLGTNAPACDNLAYLPWIEVLVPPPPTPNCGFSAEVRIYPPSTSGIPPYTFVCVP